MITDADVKKLSQVFLTKKEAEKFATKDDLKQFATKEDLKQFATKEDLKTLSDKTDKFIVFTLKEFDRVDKRFEVMDEKLDSFRSEVLTRMDFVVGELKAVRNEQISHLALYDNIEKRLQKLELQKLK